MKAPQIHVWLERIDDLMVSVNAVCRTVQRGGLYEASCFVLMDRANVWTSDWREPGRVRLRRVIATEHGGRLPWVGDAGEF